MTVPYTTGLHPLGTDTYAYLQASRAIGYSNAGLVRSGDQALLVDTLYTLAQTRQLLDAVGAELPGVDLRYLVNTHNDGDHWWGNELVPGAEVVASAAAAGMMRDAGPDTVDLFRNDADPRLGEMLAPFDFDGITPTYPGTTFTGELELAVGRRTVRLVEVGPAHTIGDVLVHVPDAGVVFAGDVAIFGAHGVIHTGPFANCVRACELILDLDVHTVVPGHGAVGGKAEVARYRDHLVQVWAHAERTREQGKSPLESAREFDFGDVADWEHPERVILNIGTAYRELNGDGTPAGLDVLRQMVELTETMENRVTT